MMGNDREVQITKKISQKCFFCEKELNLGKIMLILGSKFGSKCREIKIWYNIIGFTFLHLFSIDKRLTGNSNLKNPPNVAILAKSVYFGA